MDLPRACTLTAEQLQERRGTLLAGIHHSALTIEALDTGYAYTFTPDTETFQRLTEPLTRSCCQFLTFKIVVEPKRDLRLEITGPLEARPVIAEYFGSKTHYNATHEC